ncbi:MAG: hypothetical protein ACOY0T_15185 [Myxococcota bacterium]
MTNSLESLAKLAAHAAPATPEGPHLSAEQLAAVRSTDEDDPALDEVFLHLASCAACRARLSEPSSDVQALVQRSEPLQASVVPISSKRRRVRKPWFAGLAVAASVLLVFAITSRRGAEPSATLSQRSYAGVMGQNPAQSSSVAPEDQNIELTLQGKSFEAARVLIADAQGQVVAPWQSMRPSPSGLRAVLAPRTFRAHRAELYAIVVYGDEAVVASAAVVSSESSVRSFDELRALIERRAGAAHVISESLRVR